MSCDCENDIYAVSTDLDDGIGRCAYCGKVLWFYRTAEYDTLNGWLE